MSKEARLVLPSSHETIGTGQRFLPCPFSLLFPLPVLPLLVLATALLSAAALPEPANSRSGGILRLARLFDPATLDAAKVELTEDVLLVPLLNQTLLDVRDGTNLVPNAASEWSTSPDKRIYHFRLRPGVRFSNGREVVAADYVYALERMLDPATACGMASYLKGIRGASGFTARLTNHVAGLSAPSRETLNIEMERPDPTFGFILTSQGVAVPQEEVARLGPQFSIRPVGAGPYLVREWKRGVRLRLARNPHYRGVEPQHLDGVDILIGGDETTHLMMFERGELDIANITFAGIPRPSFHRLSRDRRWRDLIESEPLFESDFITLNTEVPPLTNVLVRRAINHAINRDKWEHVPDGYATHGEGVIPRIMPGFNPALRGYTFDPGKARQLLSEAGLPTPVRTVLWHPLDGLSRDEAQGVQEDLKQVGIELTLKPVTFAQLETAMQIRHQVPMGLTGWSAAIPDPVDILGQQFDGRAVTNAATWNQAFYQNPEVDRLLDEAAPEVDLKRRFGIYQRAEEIIVRDAPLAFLGHRNMYGLRQRRLKGALMDSLWTYRFDRVWFEP